jgi:hypothetical protein
MAIRLKYQIGAGIPAAYAAGQSAARRRSQKYVLDMWAQERRRQQAMQGRVARAGSPRAEPGGRWDDPIGEKIRLSEKAGVDPGVIARGVTQDRIQQNAQRRAAMRRARLGKAQGATDLLPQFTPQAQIDQEQEELEWERKVKHDQEMERMRQGATGRELDIRAKEAQKAREFGVEQQDRMLGHGQFLEGADELIAADEEMIEEGQFSDADAKALRGFHHKMRQTTTSGHIWDEAQRRGILEKFNRDRERILRRARPVPTRQERLRKAIGDAAFEKYGHLPWVLGEGDEPSLPRGFTMPESPEARAAQQQKEAAATQKDRAKKRSDRAKELADQSYQDAMADYIPGTKAPRPVRQPRTAFLEEADSQIAAEESFGIGAPDQGPPAQGLPRVPSPDWSAGATGPTQTDGQAAGPTEKEWLAGEPSQVQTKPLSEPTPVQIASAQQHQPGRTYRHGEVFKVGDAYYQYDANTGRDRPVSAGGVQKKFERSIPRFVGGILPNF